jgi:putative ABC transport system substrate-binding protein
VARAQQLPPKIPRIGIIDDAPIWDPFRRGLRELGYVEGRDITIEYRSSEGRPDRLAAAVADLAKLPVDVFVTWGSAPTRAAQHATTTIPIVMTAVGDPIKAGFVQSLARPGGNATGFTNSHASMGGKWLEILMEVAPKTARVGVLFNPDTAPRNGDFYLKPMQDLASTFGIEIFPAPLSDVAAITPTIASYAAAPVGGLVVTPDSFTVSHRAIIATAAAQYRVPAVYPYYYFVAAGGLISYGFSSDAISPEKSEVIVTTVEYIDLILRGANPGDLPVRSPRNYELLINLKAAMALGLTVPPALLARADKVLE